MPYIAEHVVKEIESKGEIQNIIGEYVALKKSGANLSGECPFCNAQKKFSVSVPKNIWKCWSCNASGVGYVGFVRKLKPSMSYPEVLELLARKLNITIEYKNDEPPILPSSTPSHKLPKAPNQQSFRDLQLHESGLTNADQKYRKSVEGADYIEMDRYQKGSVNSDWTVDTGGDDMVMHYMGLDGHPMKYHRKGLSKEFPLIRVRYANPALHTDKNGRPMKYQSPPGSGTHIWINQTLRTMYENGTKIQRLFIQEGEKKADKATKHGLISIGIMGIHNIAANKQLPREFELVIKKCAVEDVVFIVDSDFLDISDNLNNPVDQRPRSFMRAILNFHDYFYALNASGISLNIYFGYIRPDQKQKGIDDLLHCNFKNDEKKLVEDVFKTMLQPNGQGEYINVHKITGIQEYKLRKEFFHMETNQEFANFHKEKLKARGIFKIGRENFKFSTKEEFPELEPDTLVLAQPISANEEFWEEKWVKRGDGTALVTTFKYVECCEFLSNRKFGRYKLTNDGEFTFIKLDGMIVSMVKPAQIREYMMDFVRNALQKRNVLEMLYKGSKMYLSDNLNNINYIHPHFHKPSRGLQYMYFKDTYWKITAEGIEEKQLTELDGHIWAETIKDFNASLLKPLVKVEKDAAGNYSLKFPAGMDVVKKCHFFRYLWNTSNFYWRDTHEGFYSKQKPNTDRIQLDDQKMNDIMMHFISKCVALGFMHHRYFDPNNAKAVIAMDGMQSEVGSSNGRSGKSLTIDSIKAVTPTFIINGKAKDLADDKFLLDGITEATGVVAIDDTRVNFDFEAWFSYVNGYWRINPKGAKSFDLPREFSPKLFITTNHSINGEGGSFRDRMFLIAYSDYYNENYSPVDDLGIRLFDEWPPEQWNLYFNLVACCLQIYFEHGLVAPPLERLEQRRLRQQIGEAMIEWAEMFYDPERETNHVGSSGSNINEAIERHAVFSDFLKEYPQQAKYIDNRKFKKLLKDWCKYKGYELNPGCKNGDDKRGGKEYFTVADNNYKKQDSF